MLFAQFNMILIKFQFFLLPLLFVFNPGIFTQEEELPKKLDVNGYEKLILRYRYANPDSATYYANLGLAYSKKSKDFLGEARMLNQLGMIDDNLGNFEESREKYLRALEIFKNLNNHRGIIKLNIRLGVVENRKGNYAKAITYFFQALKVSEQTNDNVGRVESYVTIGEVYAHQKNHAIALEYYHKADALGYKIPFSNITLNLYNDLGTSYAAIGQFDKAKSYYEKGITLSQTPQMMGLQISMINGLAVVYYGIGNVSKAIELQNEALQKSRKINNFIREVLSLKGLSDSYSHINPKKSMAYLQEALEIAKAKKANKIIMELLNNIAELQSKNNDFQNAYLTKDQQYKIADSFYFKDISEKISNLQSQYELSKSKSDVQALRFQNSQQMLERKALMWVLICSFLVISILGLYFLKTRNLNRLLNKANKDLTELNQVKDKIFSVLGHDLRSPLTSISNVLYLINEGMLNEEELATMMQKLAVTCHASMETLDMLLKWGQMQLKGVKIQRVSMFPLETVSRNIRLLSAAADEKFIRIINLVPESISVEMDADHFDFITRNLLSNAIKFTPKGGEIVISTVIIPEDPQIQFKVSDNGIGIEKSKHKSVFEINNVSTRGTDNEKGTSLGLVICKEFVEANGGEIWVESVPDHGSTFFFTVVLKSNVSIPGEFALDIP
jgi:signal transduction histidine kinase